MWSRKTVLVTGGASFIGSHLVDWLVKQGASVRVADNLSTGSLHNISRHINRKDIEFIRCDLRTASAARRAVKGVNVVFHLAACHGGRGFIESQQVACWTNSTLDMQVFQASADEAVDKVIFASSACVYPPVPVGTSSLYEESMVGPPYNPDTLYGLAKLGSELFLRRCYQEGRLRSACLRFFTVYGPRSNDSHFLTAMIGRALRQEDPIEVWGDGSQSRSWTHVDDVIRGVVAAAEIVEDAGAVNLSSSERRTVAQAVDLILKVVGYSPRICWLKGMPTGPQRREADIATARSLLGWEPRIRFSQGVRQTVQWYRSCRM